MARDHRSLMMAVWVIVMIFMVITVQLKTTATTNAIRVDEIASCERVNKLREQANETTTALQDFLIAAEKARRAQADIAETKEEREENLKTAEEYRELHSELHVVPLTDCKNEFK